MEPNSRNQRRQRQTNDEQLEIIDLLAKLFTMVNVCVLHSNENKTGKKIHFRSFYGLLVPIFCLWVRVCARGIQSIIDWISLHTFERVDVHAYKHPRKCVVYTIWSVDIFFILLRVCFPPVNHTVHELHAHSVCVCALYTCCVRVWVSFVTLNAFTRVFFRLFARLFVCLLGVFGRLFYIRAVMRDNLPPLLLHHKTISMSENCKHSKVKWREQHHKTITIQYST